MAIRIELRRRALLQGALGSLLAVLVGPRWSRRGPRAPGNAAAPTPIVWIGHC